MLTRLVLAAASLAVVVCLVATAGCSRDRQPPQVTIGSTTWTVELATTPAERYKGLSNRAHIGDNEGMLFIFPSPRRLEFCMRGCEVPLDIAFLDADRRIIKIATMAVEPDRVGRTPYYSDGPAVYALEVRGGLLAKAGAKVGDVVRFSGPIPPPAKAEP